MTEYAWTFDCYKLEKNADGTTSKSASVDLTVVAESVDLAEEDAKNVLPGYDIYELDAVIELSDKLQPVKVSRY